MKKTENNIPLAVRIISLYYITVACLILITMAIGIYGSGRFSRAAIRGLFSYEILLIIVLNILVIISAAGLLKADNRARILLLGLSAVYIVFNIYLFVAVKFISVMSAAQILMGLFTIWRLTRQDVISMVSRGRV